MASSSSRRPGVAEALNHFKKDYRARFCHGGGKKIDVQPGQNILKLVQDCFESCGSDLTINSPSATHCSTPVVKDKKRTSAQSQGPKAGLTNSVERACNSAEPLPASPIRRISSRGRSHESPLKPAIHESVAVSKKTKYSVSKRELNNILKDVEALCKSPALSSDSDDDHGSFGSPLLVKQSPLHELHGGEQNTPAAAKSRVEVENLEKRQAGKDEQVALVQGREPVATSSVRKEKSFSSVVLAAVGTGAVGKRYSTSVSPPSPPLVKDQDTEIDKECEFLIDEADSVSFNSWLSIPSKSKKSKKSTPATPVSKSRPSEKEKTENKKGKSRKVQVEAPTKQKMDDLDVGVHDLKGTSESDPVSNSEGKTLKSQRQNSTPVGKTKKDALRQGSPHQKKDTSGKPKAEELILSQPGLETKASAAEQCKTQVMPSKDLPVPSAGHQQEWTVSPKKNLRSSKNLQSASKASQQVAHKKKTAKQKLPEDTVAKAESPRKKLKKSGKKSSNKKPRLQREENSDSDPGEEELEREPVKWNEAFTPPLRQKSQTSVGQKLSESEKPQNVLHVLESLGADNETLLKALQYLVDSVKNSEKKQLPAKSSGKIPAKIRHRRSEGVYSNAEDAVSQMDSDSPFVQEMARKQQKLPNEKIKSNKRKRSVQHEVQDTFAAEKAVSCESGPVQEHDDKFASRSKSCEQDNNIFSDSSEDLNSQVRDLLSDNIARHKIIMPSNTPNVRRTKRIRLRPLEYWRGERVNYAMSPSGSLVVSGILRPETEPQRKIKQRKGGHKQKRDETRGEIPADLEPILADASKPTVVLDPLTNEEVLLECVNARISHSYFFKDETVVVYKHLNTPAFATGRLILKPLKEKGQQYVHMDILVFHIIYGKIIVTLHNSSYYLTTGDFFYVPAGNEYNIRNLLDEESILLFTQLKER